MNRIALCTALVLVLHVPTLGGAFIVLPDDAALGVSPDGLTVVGQRKSTGLATKWTAADGQTDLPESGWLGRAGAASADGSYIVGFRYQNPDIWEQAVRWTSTGSLYLGQGVGRDVNPDGSVVVGTRFFGEFVNPKTEPFRWTEASGMVGLGYLPGSHVEEGTAAAVSADGQRVVGAARSANGLEAFRWTEAEGMVGLGDLPTGNYSSGAIDISADGSVIVGNGTVRAGTDDNVTAGFRWTQSTGMVSLGDYTRVANISDDGSTIVGNAVVDSIGQAVLWAPTGGMHTIKSLLEAQGIDMTGWVLGEASGVSADGRVIVGRARHGSDAFVNYVAIIPEPATFTMLASTAVMAAGFLRRR